MDLEEFEGRFEDIKIVPVPVSYSLMGPFSLLFGLGVPKRINLVSKRINNILKSYSFDQACIHCHSNGTKVFSCLDPDIIKKFDWVFFAGSICHSDDDIALHGVKNRVINDCGLYDIYPLIASSISPRQFGHTGVVGFNNHPIIDRYFRIGHSQAISAGHFSDWIIPILRTGRVPKLKHKCPRFLLYIPRITRFLSAILIALLLLYYVF